MSRKFLQATLVGNQGEVVAEFADLGGTGQGYAGQVFARAKPFNAWRVISGTHPASGEATLVRTRQMYNGNAILSIAQVQPKAGFETSHEYLPANFEPVLEIQHGKYGAWVAPTENTPPGAVAGMSYPIHRDPNDFRRYVVLRVEQAPAQIGGEPTPEMRFNVDASTARSDGTFGGDDHAQEAAVGHEPADADEDLDDDL